MIHHCSGSSHDCHKCSLHHSILLWCPWGCIFKLIPRSFLSDSVSRTLFSRALSHLIILTWNSCLAFKAIIQSIIGLTCSFYFFKKKLFLYFVASSTNITQCCLPPMLGVSLMRYPNTSFLQDCYFYLHSSLGYFSVLFSSMRPIPYVGIKSKF